MKELFLALRVERTIPSVALILFSVIFTKNFNLEIVLLATSLILIYSIASLHNAIKDNDYNLPKQTNKLIVIILIIIFLISFYNPLIFIADLLWISLGYIYNTISRKIILLDTTIMSFTHYFMPIFFSLILLGNNFLESLKLSLIIYSVFWFITPMKNLKESKKDKKLGYKTIITSLKKGKIITILLWVLSLIPLTYSYTLISKNYLLPTAILSLSYLPSAYFIKQKKEKKILIAIRVSMTLYILSLIFLKLFS